MKNILTSTWNDAANISLNNPNLHFATPPDLLITSHPRSPSRGGRSPSPSRQRDRDRGGHKRNTVTSMSPKKYKSSTGIISSPKKHHLPPTSPKKLISSAHFQSMSRTAHHDTLRLESNVTYSINENVMNAMREDLKGVYKQHFNGLEV